MRLVLFGSSIVSAYWNGAATYYRGICKAMHARGHAVVFVEPDIYDRQQHRDLVEDPPYAEVRVCRGWDDLARELERARGADLVAKCSGVGGWDMELARGVLELRRPGTLVAFWDVDAPQTLAAAFAEPPDDEHTFRALIPRYDLVLLYGGGPPVQAAYARLGARAAHPIYNAVDPDEYYPVEPRPERTADLIFMGNRMPDREARVRDLFFRAAELAPELRFVLGGEGWGDCPLPPNVRWIGHVPTAEHRAWNCSARMVLNINREAMASYGFSPPTRVFEAAGCACCLITDAWDGIEHFLTPGQEILVARTAEEIVQHLRSTSPERARAIGQAARARVLRDHTYDGRAELLERAISYQLSAISRRSYQLSAISYQSGPGPAVDSSNGRSGVGEKLIADS
jgi:spore maturation protein CgeB